jgi:hydroxyacylglutathione hydrolase
VFSKMKKVVKSKFDINGYEIRLIVTDRLWKQNCYLVTNKQNGDQVLIDPGLRAEYIKEKVQENGSGTLKSIFLTHAHFDHIGAADEISREFNVPCILHELDHKLLRQATMYLLRFGGKRFSIPENVITFSRTTEIEKNYGFDMRSILTPGHTKGGVCYWFEGFVFTGDTLLYESVGRADLPGSDLAVLRESINLLLDQNSDDVTSLIFSGHGRHWTTPEAKSWWKEARLSMPQHNMFLK